MRTASTVLVLVAMLSPVRLSRAAGAAGTANAGGVTGERAADAGVGTVEMGASSRDELFRLFDAARLQADPKERNLTELLGACRIEIDSEPVANTTQLRRRIGQLPKDSEVHLQSCRTGQHLWLSPGTSPNANLVALPSVEVTKTDRDVALVRWRLCAAGTAQQIIDRLEKLGTFNGVVIDVRDNPGGHLLEAVQLAEAFSPARTELLSLYRSSLDRQSRRPWMTLRTQREQRWHVPVAMITSGTTASTAEAATAMLRAHARAQVVGDTTKGDATAYVLLKDENNAQHPRPVPMLIEVAGVPLYQRAGLTPDFQIGAEPKGAETTAGEGRSSFARRCADKALAVLKQPPTPSPSTKR